jgi:CheY-like chemotaxis protein
VPHFPILLVDDDENEIAFVRRTFEQAGLKHPILIVKCGAECLRYLGGEREFADRERFPLPALVLLDITMSAMDGLDVLRWIKHQPKFEDLCVVVLTTSDQIRKANLAYQLGANSFLVKPLESWSPQQLTKMVERLLQR